MRISQMLLASSKPSTMHFAVHSPLTCQWLRHSRCWSSLVECPGWGQTGNGTAGEEAGAKMEPAAPQPWQLSHWNQKLLPEMTIKYLSKQSAHWLNYSSWAHHSHDWYSLDLHQWRTRMIPELDPHPFSSTTMVYNAEWHSEDSILFQHVLFSNLHFKVPTDIIHRSGSGELTLWRSEYVLQKEIISWKNCQVWVTASL